MASRKYSLYPIITLFLLSAFSLYSEGRERTNSRIVFDIPSLQDTIKKDSLKTGSLSAPAFSGAKDSIIEDFTNGKKIIYYYGDVTVKYLTLELKAAYMEYDVDKRVVFAKGMLDTAGILVGKPIMSENGKSYTMEEVTYNFDSRKAGIKNIITQEDEGFLHGAKLKKLADNTMNISGAKYTTCDLDHPHFYLKMPVARVITGKNPMTVFGPSYLVLEDVPTPFFLPFGFVPKIKNRSGGLLIPTYGEEIARGFFLKGLGYYFVLGNNLDLSVTSDIYSMGSWSLQLNSRYKKRYKYNGLFSLTMSNNQTGEKDGPDFVQSRDFGLQWNHTQDSKSRPGMSFTASVNFSSPSNNKYNTTSIQNALQNQISSSISFSKNWAGTPFSIAASALHSQSSLDSSYSINFPNLRFDVRTIYPFRKLSSVGKRKFYEEISFQYNTSIDNSIKFKASQVTEPDFLSLFKSGMKHNFQIGLPSFSLFKYIQLSPSISYGMNWFFQKNTKEYNSETNLVEDNMSNLFETFGITQDFSGGLSANTRITGIFNLGKKGKLQKIRHMITPSLSFSFRPEMGTSWNGYTQYNYVDINGIQHTLDYNKYSGQINSPPSPGKSAAINFSMGNNIEGKVIDDADTSGDGFKIVKLIDNLALGGSYNFLADSMNMSNISINLSTTIFGKLGLSANAVLDPYAIDGTGKRINKYNIAQNGILNFARLINSSLSFTYQISGEGKGAGGSGAPPGGGKGSSGLGADKISGVKTEAMEYTKVYYHPITGEYIPGGWVYYLEPNIPWSVNFNYNMTYNREYNYTNELLTTKHNYIQTLGISAQIRFTPALNVNLNTGVDIVNKKLTTTQLNATYDLHDFIISFSWIPQGQWQSWSFRINAKASALADLLQFKKNASYWDN